MSPKGFAAVINPIATASLAQNALFPSASYETSQSLGTSNLYNPKGYLGWRFQEKDQDNYNWLRPLPAIEESNVSGEFNVDEHMGHISSSLWLGSLSASVDVTGGNGTSPNQLKFTVPFQGGTDGIAPWIHNLIINIKL